MLTQLALIFLTGLFLAAVSRRMYLPRIVGMLLVPSILGVTGIKAAVLGAVLAILITAALGALGMDASYRRLLSKR